MEAFGNLTNGSELGYISPLDMKWFAVFEFDPSGYVKDDEKDKLDADAILEQLKEGQEAANKELSKRGMSTLTVLGWQRPPFYNPLTHNLEWAIRLRGGDGDNVVNYKTKLLGRRGVMDVVLVCDEEEMPTVIPEYQKLLAGFAFKKEESYAAFTKGDRTGPEVGNLRMKYRLLISMEVVEFLERLPSRIRKALRNVIEAIGKDPMGDPTLQTSIIRGNAWRSQFREISPSRIGSMTRIDR